MGKARKFCEMPEWWSTGMSEHFMTKLIWTPCLMHRCVCIWRYILQNYNYKLHFQNLSIYNIPHVGTLAAENLDVCTACDPWDSNIQLTMVKDQRLGPGMPFLDSNTCAEGRVIYFCQGFLPCMMPSMDGWRDGWMDGRVTWCHPWMDDETDGWKKLRDHNVLYYM
jgi:hypothetical protein